MSKMPKSFTKDIGDASYNAFSTEAPALADYSSAIKQAGDIGKKIYTESAESTLVGEEGAQVPGIEGLGEARIKAGSEFDMEKALNLRQIKRAKEQGLINETQARIKVGQAIRSVAEDYPGQEDELRAKANTYFGKFGEGDLTLTKSSAQKQQEAIFVQSFLKPGVAAGIIDPKDPSGDMEGQADWQKITHDRTIRASTRDVVETQAALGKASSSDVAGAYISSDVSDDIAGGITQLLNAKKEGKAITDPLEIKGLFNAQKAKHKQILRTRLARVKGGTSDQRKQALAELDAAYKDLEQMVDDGSFVKMLEQREDVLTRTATVYGIAKFPELFAMERVAKGSGLSMLQMADTMGRIQGDAARNAYIDRQPSMVRQFIRNSIDNPISLGSMFMESMSSNVVPGQEWLDGLFLKTATDGMSQPSIEEESDKDIKDLSISYVLKNAPSIKSLESLNNPSVSIRIKKDPKKINMLKNKFVAHEQSAIPEANDLKVEGTHGGRKLEYTFDFNTHKFSLNLTDDPNDWPGGYGRGESASVDKLNTLYNTIDYYGQELDIKLVEWVMETLETVNSTPETEE